MNIDSKELKAVAKAVGASLARSGHPVPHTAVLNALASAANKKSWNVLKAVVAQAPQQNQPSNALAQRPVAPEPVYTNGTWFLLQLAYALGHGIPAADLVEEKDVRAWALSKTTCGLDGLLKWGGWNLPATLDISTCKLDAGDFVPETNSVERGTFKVNLATGEPLVFHVSYSKATGWILSDTDAALVRADLERRVPRKELIDQGLALGHASYAIPALVETDDDMRRVDFDAAGFFQTASQEDIQAIIDQVGNDGLAMDKVADWAHDFGPKKDELRQLQAYLEDLQRNPECETGYTCRLEMAAVVDWLQANRPEVLAKVLCRYFDVSLLECQEEEIRGRWDWLSATDACPTSYESEEEAAVMAMHALALVSEYKAGLVG